MSGVKSISIMGSTGSIGTSALSVVEHANTQADAPVFEIDTLVAGRNAALLVAQAKAFEPKCVVLADSSGEDLVKRELSGSGIEVLVGEAAVIGDGVTVGVRGGPREPTECPARASARGRGTGALGTGGGGTRRGLPFAVLAGGNLQPPCDSFHLPRAGPPSSC